LNKVKSFENLMDNVSVKKFIKKNQNFLVEKLKKKKNRLSFLLRELENVKDEFEKIEIEIKRLRKNFSQKMINQASAYVDKKNKWVLNLGFQVEDVNYDLMERDDHVFGGYVYRNSGSNKFLNMINKNEIYLENLRQFILRKQEKISRNSSSISEIKKKIALMRVGEAQELVESIKFQYRKFANSKFVSNIYRDNINDILSIYIETKNLRNKNGINFGKFIFCFSPVIAKGFNITYCMKNGHGSDNYDHPHIKNGEICYGSDSSIIAKYLGGLNFYFAFEVIIKILTSKVEGHPYVPSNEWNLLKKRIGKNALKIKVVKNEDELKIFEDNDSWEALDDFEDYRVFSSGYVEYVQDSDDDSIATTNGNEGVWRITTSGSSNTLGISDNSSTGGNSVWSSTTSI